MAIRISSDLQCFGIHEPEGHTLPAFNAAWTVSGLYRYEGVVADNTLLAVFYGADDASSYIGAYIDGTGTNVMLIGQNGSGESFTSGYPLTVGREYRFGMVYDGAGTIKLYDDHVELLSLSFSPIAGVTNQHSLQFGGFGEIPGYTNSTYARWRLWSQALTPAQLRAEHRSYTPVVTSNLLANWPMDAGSNRLVNTVPGESPLFINPGAAALTDGVPFEFRPTVLGTPQHYSLGTSATPSAVSMTVPEYAEGVAIFGLGSSNGSAYTGVASVSTNFTGTVTLSDHDATPTSLSTFTAVAPVTATGSGRTVTVAWDNAQSICGASIYVAFLQDYDGTAWPPTSAHANATGDGSTAGTANIISETNRLVLAVDGRIDVASATGYPANQSGYTSLQTGSSSGTYFLPSRLRQATPPPAAGTQSATTQTTYASALSMLSLKGKALANAPASIKFVGSATGTNTATMPTHEVGDLILVYAFRDGSATAPSLASGYNNINDSGANTCAQRVGWKIAASTSETVGTWTNATSTIVAVYRGVDPTTPIGATAVNGGSSTTINYPALTLGTTDGTSWVVGAAGHRSTNVAIENAPPGLLNRTSVSDATDEAALHDTGGGTTSWVSANAAVGGTASGYRSIVIELRRASAGGSSKDISAAISQATAVSSTVARARAASSTIAQTSALSAAIMRAFGVSAAISESSALTSTLQRALGLQAAINQAEDMLVDTQRVRGVGTSIAQEQALVASLMRARATSSEVIQTLNVAAAMNRQLGVIANIDQVMAMTVDITLDSITYLSASIDYAVTVDGSLARTRGMSVMIDELQTHVTSLLRARSITSGISQLHTLDGRINRVLGLVVSLAETAEATASLARQRNVDASIGVVYTMDETDLIRLKALASTISQSIAMDASSLQRVRGLSALVEQVEAFSAALERMRQLGVVINQESMMTTDMSRFRSVVAEIIEAQDVTAGSMRRVRGIASDIAQVLGCTVSIRILNAEPGVSQLTISWFETVHLGDGVFDRVERSETVEIRRVSQEISFEVHGAPSPLQMSGWDDGASWDGGAEWV